MKKYFSKYWLNYILSFAIAFTIVLLFLIFKQGWNMVIVYSNACFVAGIVLICLGGLSWVNLQGGYDIFQYMFAKKTENGHRPPLYDFSEAKKEKRKKRALSFLPYIIIGVVFLSIALILLPFISR